MSRNDWRAAIKTQVNDLAEFLAIAPGLDYSKPLSVEVKPVSKRRSLNQNSLYWMWLKQMADHFSKKAGPYCDEEMHDLMRHLYLGYEDKRIGNTVIGNQLCSTKDLEPGLMSEYMSKIEAWAVDNGCLVTIPAHSQYAEWIEGKR